jgi:hypothetical protein
MLKFSFIKIDLINSLFRIQLTLDSKNLFFYINKINIFQHFFK